MITFRLEIHCTSLKYIHSVDWFWEIFFNVFFVLSPVGYSWWLSILCADCLGLGGTPALVLCNILLSLFTSLFLFCFSWNNTHSHTQTFSKKKKKEWRQRPHPKEGGTLIWPLDGHKDHQSTRLKKWLRAPLWKKGKDSQLKSWNWISWLPLEIYTASLSKSIYSTINKWHTIINS